MSKQRRSEASLLLNSFEIGRNFLKNQGQIINYSIHKYTAKTLKFLENVIFNAIVRQNLDNVPQIMTISEDVTNDTLFIYKAFVDQRQAEDTLIRLLVFSPCRDIVVTLHYRSVCVSAKDVAIEADCPWKWASNCKWFPFMLNFSMRGTNFSESTEAISITEGNRQAVVPLQLVPNHRQDTLHVCVPPLYWYWNYAALVQFLEIWTRQGATLFYIYYVSVTRQLMDILKIYEEMGVVKLVRWKMMPRSTTVDPNRWIYRFGHTLAFNDCLYQSTAKYVAIVDIDEFIIPSSGTLLSLLRKTSKKDKNAGSFIFEHSKVRFPNYEIFNTKKNFDFSLLKYAQYRIHKGPCKTVLMPERVEVMTTHYVRVFLEAYRSYRVNIAEALLYHARSSWIFNTGKHKSFQTTDIFEKYIEPLNERYNELMLKVPWSEENPVHLWKKLPKKIATCLADWRKYCCKVPHYLCWKSLKDQGDWIFSDINSDNDYILL